MTDYQLNDWIQRLSNAWGYKISSMRLRVYAEKLISWKLTDAQMEILWRRLTDELEKFPSIAEIRKYAHGVLMPSMESTEPNWRTWKDNGGRAVAQRLSGYHSTVPSDRDIEQWKREACSRSEARRLWREGYIKSGGDPAKCDAVFAQIDRALKTKEEKTQEQDGQFEQVMSPFSL